MSTPINKLIDEACGFNEDKFRLLQAHAELTAYLFENVIKAVEDWYEDPRKAPELAKAWENLRDDLATIEERKKAIE